MSKIRSAGAGFLCGAGLGLALVLLPLGWIHSADRRETALPFALPATALHASATDSADSFAVATGRIDQDMEAVFFLDPLLGQLQCWVMNKNTRQFTAVFGYDKVFDDIGLRNDKNPRCLLVTGETNFAALPNAPQLAQSVVYVVNSKTGQFAAYGVPWTRQVLIKPRYISGLVRLDGGKGRAMKLRDENQDAG